MTAIVGKLTSAWCPFDWTLLFARQPEPDLEFTEEELDQTILTKSRGSMPPPKKSSGGSPILWVLLLALVGGIAYVSMEPELLTEWLSPYLGESTPPPVAMKPKPATPAPVVPAAPAPRAIPSPDNMASALSAPAAVPQPQSATRPATPVGPSLDPLFSEGQKVTVTVNDTAPGGNISLFADSSSSKPGAIVRPGASLTVIDGDLQPGGWMYMVRTEEGVTGWVTEKRLRLKF